MKGAIIMVTALQLSELLPNKTLHSIFIWYIIQFTQWTNGFSKISGSMSLSFDTYCTQLKFSFLSINFEVLARVWNFNIRSFQCQPSALASSEAIYHSSSLNFCFSWLFILQTLSDNECLRYEEKNWFPVSCQFQIRW